MKTAIKSEYDVQAKSFLESTGTRLELVFLGTFPYFPDDKEKRDVYQFNLVNAKGSYAAKFGDSLVNTTARFKRKPSAYDVLACLDGYAPGSFADFCADYGYDSDSRKALEVYLDVQAQYDGLAKMFDETELEQLSEIQ